MKFKILINRNLCTLCRICVIVCQKGIIIISGKEIKIYEEFCSGCRSCEIWCRKNAIKVLK